MSRSYKKTPYSSHTKAESDKPYKEQEHRRERRKVKHIITSAHDYDDVIFPDKKDYGDEWNAPKDGKHYYQNPTGKDLRK